MWSIRLLNHASVIIKYKEFSLLCDPWFEGTAFDDGWGLQYINPNAWQEAYNCSHLWVSHFHSDHLHIPTLRKISQTNPNLIVFSNPSANLNTQNPLVRVGFRNFIPLTERKRTAVFEDVSLTRFPTTGIDNMLSIRLGDFTILNYNDCNIPERAIRKLIKTIGPVDVLLINFNHAGKLIQVRTDHEIKEFQRRLFQQAVQTIQPRYVIPFASMHYYRSPYSQDQNASLLSLKEISSAASNAIPLALGGKVVFQAGGRPPKVDAFSSEIRPEARPPHIYKESHEWHEIVQHAERFCVKIRREYLGLTFWMPKVVIWVEDCGKGLILDFRRSLVRGSSFVGPHEAHICSHSEALIHWFSQPAGSINFQVGAHYKITSKERRPIILLLLVAGLMDNALGPRKMLKMLFEGVGWIFLFNRREEIWAVLRQRRIGIESRL